MKNNLHRKKLLSLMTFALLCCFSFLLSDTYVNAAEGQLVYGGPSKQNATNIEMNTLYCHMKGSYDYAWYQFTTPNVPGNLVVKAEETTFDICSADGTDMTYGLNNASSFGYQRSTRRMEPNTTYYIKVYDFFSDAYTFELDYWADIEPDTKQEAFGINSNQIYQGNLTLRDDVDMFKYTADQSGLHRFSLNAKTNEDEYYSYDIRAELRYYASERVLGSTTNYEKDITSFDVYLDKGETTYFNLTGAKGDYSVAIYNAKVSSIQLNATGKVFDINERFLLQPTVAPTYAVDQEVEYTSSNTKVATVDEYGNVKAIAPGKATITCSAKDGGGAKATFSVVVKPGKASLNKTLIKPVSTTTARIAWNKQAGVSGYYIYQKETNAKSYVLVKDIAGDATTSCVVSKLQKGKSYQYYVQAYVKDDAAVYVGIKSATNKLSPLPAKVANVKRTKKTNKNKSKTYTYTWSKTKGAAGYEVYVKQSNKNLSSSKWKKVNWKYNKRLSSNKVSYTRKNGDMKFKVRAYVTVNGKRYYGAYSKEL
ncbi:hypothetical protein lbkm_2422 [Lachnospiraceae bacterium KM106-2]|nr:hypothetical protein lbkm_2422 [Lachnospiraceae bacterium KM106-2]